MSDSVGAAAPISAEETETRTSQPAESQRRGGLLSGAFQWFTGGGPATAPSGGQEGGEALQPDHQDEVARDKLDTELDETKSENTKEEEAKGGGEATESADADDDMPKASPSYEEEAKLNGDESVVTKEEEPTQKGEKENGEEVKKQELKVEEKKDENSTKVQLVVSDSPEHASSHCELEEEKNGKEQNGHDIEKHKVDEETSKELAATTAHEKGKQNKIGVTPEVQIDSVANGKDQTGIAPRINGDAAAEKSKLDMDAQQLRHLFSIWQMRAKKINEGILQDVRSRLRNGKQHGASPSSIRRTKGDKDAADDQDGEDGLAAHDVNLAASLNKACTRCISQIRDTDGAARAALRAMEDPPVRNKAKACIQKEVVGWRDGTLYRLGLQHMEENLQAFEEQYTSSVMSGGQSASALKEAVRASLPNMRAAFAAEARSFMEEASGDFSGMVQKAVNEGEHVQKAQSVLSAAVRQVQEQALAALGKALRRQQEQQQALPKSGGISTAKSTIQEAVRKEVAAWAQRSPSSSTTTAGNGSTAPDSRIAEGFRQRMRRAMGRNASPKASGSDAAKFPPKQVAVRRPDILLKGPPPGLPGPAPTHSEPPAAPKPKPPPPPQQVMTQQWLHVQGIQQFQ